MIIFWRLFVAYYVSDLILYGQRFFNFHHTKPLQGNLLHGCIIFIVMSLFTWDYLGVDWPFLGFIDLKGYWCVLAFVLFHLFTDRWFFLGKRKKCGDSLAFLLHQSLNLLFIFLCIPHGDVYETGSLAAEPWFIFLAGLIASTYVLGSFIFAVETDCKQRDCVTGDERFLSMMVRGIFFLLMLLPGWRWMLLVSIWFGVVVFARRERIVDFSPLALYVGSLAAIAIGYLVRLRFYYYV